MRSESETERKEAAGSESSSESDVDLFDRAESDRNLDRSSSISLPSPEASPVSLRTIDKSSTRLDAAIDVIRRQFDLEILLKHRELSCIEDEIAKVHIMMVQLRRCAGKTISEKDEPDDFTKHYAQYLLPDRRFSDSTGYNGIQQQSSHLTTRSLSTPTIANTKPHNPHYPTGFTISGNPPPPGCIYRRPDGILVRLICKDCQRTTFGSAQGFINHCRISHGREFTSHDAAAQYCGEELDEGDQDDIGMNAIRQRKALSESGSSSSDSPQSANTPASTPGETAQEEKLQENEQPTESAAINAQNATSDTHVEVKQCEKGTSTLESNNKTGSNTNTKIDGKRDYGTKTFPWNYQAKASTFLSHPITPPNEVNLEQIPRQVPPPISLTSQPQVPPTSHLSSLLKRKQVDVDLANMAAESVKRDPRGHLFPGEEDVSDDELEVVAPSVAKFRKMSAAGALGHRGRPVGSGMRILANLN
ncbi:hypothetical protein V1511DRAFT_458485 [Dipodascopsis uninucleata]